MNAIFERVSIRKFKDMAVEEEKITLMLKAAMAAPSAQNQQPWEFYVVTDKEKICELSGVSPYTGCAKNAPLVIVPCYRDGLISPEYANIDMSAATQNILLEACALGLGAVWMGISPIEERMNKVKKILDIPANLTAFALVACGYPGEEKTLQNRFDANKIYYIK